MLDFEKSHRSIYLHIYTHESIPNNCTYQDPGFPVLLASAAQAKPEEVSNSMAISPEKL